MVLDIQPQEHKAEEDSAFCFKPRPNEHVKAAHRNAVGRNMLREFGHPVETWCNMLGVVGLNLTIFKLESITPKRAQNVAPSNVAIWCGLNYFNWKKKF